MRFVRAMPFDPASLVWIRQPSLWSVETLQVDEPASSATGGRRAAGRSGACGRPRAARTDSLVAARGVHVDARRRDLPPSPLRSRTSASAAEGFAGLPIGAAGPGPPDAADDGDQDRQRDDLAGAKEGHCDDRQELRCPEGDTDPAHRARSATTRRVVPVIAAPHRRTAGAAPAGAPRRPGAATDPGARQALAADVRQRVALHVHLRMTGQFRIASPPRCPIDGRHTRRGSSSAGGGIRAVLFNGPGFELLTPASAGPPSGPAAARRRRHDRRFDPAAALRDSAAAIRRTPSAARCSTSACWRASATSGAPRCCTPSACGRRGRSAPSTTRRWS